MPINFDLKKISLLSYFWRAFSVLWFTPPKTVHPCGELLQLASKCIAEQFLKVQCERNEPFLFVYRSVFITTMDDSTIPALIEKLCRSLTLGKCSEASMET